MKHLIKIQPPGNRARFWLFFYYYVGKTYVNRVYGFSKGNINSIIIINRCNSPLKG